VQLLVSNIIAQAWAYKKKENGNPDPEGQPAESGQKMHLNIRGTRGERRRSGGVPTRIIQRFEPRKRGIQNLAPKKKKIRKPRKKKKYLSFT